MNIRLIRNSKSTEATFGELFIDETFFCYTLEEIWRNNQSDDRATPEAEESCIPEGKYFLRKRYSEKYGNTPYVIGTQPKRDLILIHSGNTVEHTIGCILVGSSYGKVKSKKDESILLDAVVNSKNTFAKLMELLDASEEWKAGNDIPFEIIGQGTTL